MNTSSICFFCSLPSQNLTDELDCMICPDCLIEQKQELKRLNDNRTTFYPEINQINEKVYLGNQDAARDKALLQELGITHVLVCAAFIEEYHQKDFVYKSIAIDDDPKQELISYLKECVEFIDNGDKVFIHCHAGVSRSASVVISYFMWKEKLTFNKAKELVKEKRRCIYPNSGFEIQLLKFENILAKNNFIL
jgi:protein-tyrosine phosphatase